VSNIGIGLLSSGWDLMWLPYTAIHSCSD